MTVFSRCFVWSQDQETVKQTVGLVKLLSNCKPHAGGAFNIPNLQMREWSREVRDQHQVTQLVDGGARERTGPAGF